MAPSPPPRLLACYVRLWAAATLLRILVATGRGDPLTPEISLLVVAILMATICPSRPRIVAFALFLRIILFFRVGGPLSNSQNWAMHFDFSLLLAILGHLRGSRTLTAVEEAGIVATAGTATRLQLVIFYLASGAWKMNTSFADSEYSCASVYIVSLVGHRLSDDARLLHALARVAPVATIAGELLLPLLQAAPRPGRWSRLGVAATLLFHFLIGITPPPHNIALYGVITTTRLYFWQPEATARACAELASSRWLAPTMVVFALVTMLYVRTAEGHGNPGLVGLAKLDLCLSLIHI